MKSLIEMTVYPGLEYSRAAQIGRKLVALGLGLKATQGIFVAVLMLTLGMVTASAQTPSGSFFNGDSAQLGNSLRSITFFLAAAMIIAGIIFVAVGNHHLGTARIAFNVEIHNRRSLFRIRRHLCRCLRIQSRRKCSTG